jgi:hypothetical protein
MIICIFYIIIYLYLFVKCTSENIPDPSYGCEKLLEKLNAIGAKIKRIQ